MSAWPVPTMCRARLIAVFGLASNIPAESIYYSAFFDGDSRRLTGVKRYTMTLKEPMPYLKFISPGFWSITMYDGVSFLTVANPINRYALGSDSNLKRNVDGSITLFVQHDNPGLDKEGNWLPAPSGPFYVILRNYSPAPEIVAALQNLITFPGPPPLVPVHSFSEFDPVPSPVSPMLLRSSSAAARSSPRPWAGRPRSIANWQQLRAAWTDEEQNEVSPFGVHRGRNSQWSFWFREDRLSRVNRATAHARSLGPSSQCCGLAKKSTGGRRARRVWRRLGWTFRRGAPGLLRQP